MKDPSRCAGIHYFFPAERNVVVEITPGEATSPDVTRWLLGFYEAIGKVPIEVKSRYGYAVDPIFESDIKKRVREALQGAEVSAPVPVAAPAVAPWTPPAEQPRERSLAGLAKPCRKGPMAMAPPSRSTSL